MKRWNIVNIKIILFFYWPTLTDFVIIICFSSSSINVKKIFWGVPHLLHMCDFIILRWFWNFLIISFTDLLFTGSSDVNLLLIPKFSTIVSNYDLNVSATSLSSDTALSPSIRVILSLLTLLEKKGYEVSENCLLSVIFLTLRLFK